jgi:hypothetical protein
MTAVMPFVYAESGKTGNDKRLRTKQMLESILKSSPSGIIRQHPKK